MLVRPGHTEGSVDLARMAGLMPAGVICEVMNDDGTMARRPDLERFARRHKLTLLSIADLITWRLAHERLVQRVGETSIDRPPFGELHRPSPTPPTWTTQCTWRWSRATSPVTPPVLTRMHRATLLGDLLDTCTGDGPFARPSSASPRPAPACCSYSSKHVDGPDALC